MTLPLQDEKNPLYGLELAEQCQKLFTDGTSIKPWEFLSLDRFNYTEKQLKQAYRQLSLRFHPDRVPDDLKETAEEAFKLVSQAKEYMAYGLKSAREKQRDVEAIRHNPFYKIYGDASFSASSSTSDEVRTTSYFDEYGIFHSRKGAFKKKSYTEMSFIELLAEADAGDDPMHEAIVVRLKQFILSDKSLLAAGISKDNPKRKILNLAAEKGTEEFIIWLLEQGADPFIFPQAYRPDGYTDKIDIVFYPIVRQQLQVLRYLFNRYGTCFFYQQLENEPTDAPIWQHLELAISVNNPEATNFLFTEMAYLKHLNERKFDQPWYSALSSREDNAVVTALLMQHGLIEDLEKAMYWAIIKGSLTAAKQILTQRTQFNFQKLFKGYFYSCDERNDKNMIEFMRTLFNSQKNISAFSLKDVLEKVRNSSLTISRALLPTVFARLYHYDLPTEAKIQAQKLYQLSHEQRESLLFDACCVAADDNSSEMLKELLSIAPTLLLTRKNPQRTAPLISVITSSLRKSKIQDYEETISLLIEVGGFGLSRYLMGVKDLDTGAIRDRYIPLHFLSELGFKKQALRLVEKMVEEQCSLDDVCLRKEQKKDDSPATSYHYTALHLALEANNQELAIKLLKAGADFTINAVIERPSAYFCGCFPTVKKIEKTPLQMAIDGQQTEVLRVLQLKMLEAYIAKRCQEEIYLSHITLFGYTFLRFGFFAKTTKLHAANDYREALLRGNVDYHELDKRHEGALSQGRLGAIAQLAKLIPNNLDTSPSPTAAI